jgi:hypothetical protein
MQLPVSSSSFELARYNIALCHEAISDCLVPVSRLSVLLAEGGIEIPMSASWIGSNFRCWRTSPSDGVRVDL